MRTYLRTRVAAATMIAVGLLSFSLASAVTLSGPVSPTYMVPPGLRTSQAMGDSLALSGGYIIVGSTGAQKSPGVITGGVYLFNASTGAYVRTIFPADGVDGDRFGASVAVSGNVLAIGAPHRTQTAGPKSGAVYLYRLSTGALIRRIDPPAAQTDARWGTSLAMDGDLVAIGSPYFDGVAGADSGGMFTHRISTNVSSPEESGDAAGDLMGYSLAMWRGLIACGIPAADTADGKVRLMEGSNLGTIAIIKDPLAAGHHGTFGMSVAMDAERLLVGAPQNTVGGANAGRIVLFDISDTSAITNISFVNGGVGSALGYGIAAKDRLYAAGMSYGGTFTGLVRLFDDSLTFLDTVSPSAITSSSNFGTLVALGRDGTLAITASGMDSTAVAAGAVWKAGPYLLPFTHRLYAHLRSSEVASGAALTTFSSFGEICIPPVDSSNLASTTATLAGTGSAGGKNKGLWSQITPGNRAPGLTMRSGVATGLGPVPFATFATVTGVTRPTNNFANYLFFRGSKTAGTSLFSYDATNFLREIIAAGQPLSPGGPTASTLYEGRSTRDGALYVQPLKLKTSNTVFPPITATSDSVIALCGVGAPALVQEGVTASPAPGAPVWGEFAPRASAADLNNLVVSGFLQIAPTPSSIIMLNNSLIATSGEIANDETGLPPLSAPRYSAFLGESAMTGAAGNHLLFRASLKISTASAVSASDNEGLWLKLGAGNVKLVARKGRNITGTTLKWSRFVDYGVDWDGDVLVLAQLSGPGVNATNDMALVCLYGGDPNSPEFLLREGSAAPGCEGARVSTINLVDMAFGGVGDSKYGVLATLVAEAGGATTGNNLVWMSGNLALGTGPRPALRLPTPHLRKGERYATVPGKDLITSIALPATLRDASGAGNTGMPHVLGYGHYINAVVTFGDRSSVFAMKFR